MCAKNCPLNKFWLKQNIVHNTDGDKYSNAMMDYFRSEASHSSCRCECSIFSIFTLVQYVGTWFPSFQGQPLISGAMPLESGADFA